MSLEDQAHPNPHGLRQEKGTTPQMVGRYPRYDVLTQTKHWDEVTRRVVLDRVENVPEITFFTREEAIALKAFCDLVTAQDEEPRIPVLSYVDEKLAGGVGDGWQYEGLPGDGEVWRCTARELDREARDRTFESFATAPLEAQAGIVHSFSRAQLEWEGLDVALVWKVVMRYVCQAFYSHPWAWNEIGFGGPAYPRGYGAFGSPHQGERESWEGHESVHYDPVHDARKWGLD